MNYEVEIAMNVLRLYAPQVGMGETISRNPSSIESTLIDNAADLVNDYLLKVGRYSPQMTAQQQTAQQQIDSHILAAYTNLFGGPQTR